MIPTHNPEEEIWHHLSKLTSFQYVRDLLKTRIKNKFFNLNIDALTKIKEGHDNRKIIEKMGKRQNKRVKIYQPILEINVDNNAHEIIQTVRQAIEIYKTSQMVSLSARPVLLYYCYTRLARILFLSTYREDGHFSRTHGLRMNFNDIICKEDGTFQRFHDSYNSNPAIYVDNYVFRWQDLLIDPLNQFELFKRMISGTNFIDIQENKNDKVKYIHELTREFLFTYAMGTLQRYRIKDWTEIIEGKDSEDMLWKIQDYLRSTQSVFPNLVFNILHGKIYYFSSDSMC